MKRQNCDVHEDIPSQKGCSISNHEEDFEYQVEFNHVLWDVLLNETEAKELTDSEKKEVLKLHKYFAHRKGIKLWENLFQPAGKLKGKKKLVMDFVNECDICKKYRKTPSKPKVGMPKAKDVNDVVSLDLKIFKKKDGKRESEYCLYVMNSQK